MTIATICVTMLVMFDRKRFSFILLASCLFLLLGITAFFQIKWAISAFEIEKIRLQNSLSKSLTQMFMQATKEMFLLPNTVLQRDPTEDIEISFANTYSYWQKQAQFPEIFKSVYFYDSESSTPFKEWKDKEFLPVLDTEIFNKLDSQITDYKDRMYRSLSLSPFHTVLTKDSLMYIDAIPSQEENGTTCFIYTVDFKVFTEDFFSYYIGNEVEKDPTYYYFIYNTAKQKIVSTNHPNLSKETFKEFDFILPLLPNTEVSTSNPVRFIRDRGFSDKVDFDEEHLPDLVQSYLFPMDASQGVFSRKIDNVIAQESTLILALDHKDGSMFNATVNQIAQTLRTSLLVLIILCFGILVLLINMRKAQGLARRQQEFISTITHELKTPLAVISSAAQNLSDGIVTSPEKVKKYGQIIQKEDMRLHSSIEYFLTYSNLNTSN